MLQSQLLIFFKIHYLYIFSITGHPLYQNSHSLDPSTFSTHRPFSAWPLSQSSFRFHGPQFQSLSWENPKNVCCNHPTKIPIPRWIYYLPSVSILELFSTAVGLKKKEQKKKTNQTNWYQHKSMLSINQDRLGYALVTNKMNQDEGKQNINNKS